MVNVISDNRFFHNRSVSRAGHMTAELGSTGGYSMETGTGVLIGSAARCTECMYQVNLLQLSWFTLSSER